MTHNYRIYRNLAKECWSVQERTEKGWRVTRHGAFIFARGCRFYVSQAGRERVRAEGRKNVHAYILAETCDFGAEALKRALARPLGHKMASCAAEGSVKVTYNPYDDNGFHVVPSNNWTPKDIDGAHCLWLQASGTVYAGGLYGYRVDARSNGAALS